MRVPPEFKLKVEEGKRFLQDKSPKIVKDSIDNQVVLREFAKVDINQLLGDKKDNEMFLFGRPLGRKGITDLIYIFVSILIAGVMLIAAWILWSNFSAAFTDLSLNTSDASNLVLTNVTNMFGPADYFVLALLVGLYLGMLISASQIDVHPAFIIFFILASVLVEYLSFFISNMWQTIIADAVISGYAIFPKTTLVFQNLPYISLAMIAGGIVVIYSKLMKQDQV